MIKEPRKLNGVFSVKLSTNRGVNLLIKHIYTFAINLFYMHFPIQALVRISIYTPSSSDSSSKNKTMKCCKLNPGSVSEKA